MNSVDILHIFFNYLLNMRTVSVTMEPYRMGSSFTQWAERFEFFFLASKVPEGERKSHFITLGGPHIYSELRLLFPTGNLIDLPLATMIEKLKMRIDKTASGICQRISFNQRIQRVDETAEDFLLALKLQAEHCDYGSFKSIAIRDRLLAGLKDVSLKQKILGDADQSLESAEKLIQTWEAAKNSVQHLSSNAISITEVADMHKPGQPVGPAMNAILKLSKTLQEQENNRLSVKQRLGLRPNDKNQFSDSKFVGKKHFQSDRRWGHSRDFRPAGYRENQPDTRRYKDFRICDFCGIRGHIKRRCLKRKNLKKEAINLVDQMKPGPSGNQHFTELFERMRTEDTDSDDSDEGNLECMNITSINKISEPCIVYVQVEDKTLEMEVDCGSSVSVIY